MPSGVRVLLAPFPWCLVWAALRLAGHLTPREVRRWRTLTQLRGWAPRSGRVLGRQRARRWEQLLQGGDLARLLRTTGRSQTPLEFVVRTVGWGALAAAALATVDGLSWLHDGQLAFPPVLPFGALVLYVAQRWAQLRGEAARLVADADAQLGEMLDLVGIMIERGGMRVEDAICSLARACESEGLRSVVDGEAWRRLIPGDPLSVVELYDALGQHLDAPTFRKVAAALAAVHRAGMRPDEVFTRLALSTFEERVADVDRRTARTEVLRVGPMAAMLVPLLVLLGGAMMSAFVSGMSG